MDSSSTYWINAANIALAAITVTCLLATAGGVVHEFISRWKKGRAVSAGLEGRWQRLLNDSAASAECGPTEPEMLG
jgi:hypothetical protein